MEEIKHEHKQQLHQRIVERSTQREASLWQLRPDSQSAKSERARAVELALAALKRHLSGGWDKVDELELAALTRRWLESSRSLFDGKPVPVVDAGLVAAAAAAPSSEERLQS